MLIVAGQAPKTVPTSATTAPPGRWLNRWAMLATAVAAVVVVAAVITILVVGHLSSQKRTVQPSHQVSYSSQVVLPFTGVREPYGVAVDTAGNVYIANANNTAGNVDTGDANNNRVLKLSAGSTTPVTLPFTGLKNPSGVAVDTAGIVYIADANNNRVLKLPAGSTTQTELPFTGLDSPIDVAVDTAGNVYITDYGSYRVLKLPAR